jgi:leucine-rich repeat protein SHOC2
MRTFFLMLFLSTCAYLGAQDLEDNSKWERVRVKDKFGCIGANGDTIIKPKYKSIELCYDLADFAEAVTEDGRRVLVQAGGQEYNYATSFAELSPKTEAFILDEERSLLSVIKKAPNLKILLFYTQYVSEIPKEIEQLTQLTHLKALHWAELVGAKNVLASIHANIGNLKKLKYLDLDIPNVALIPETIAKLSSLEELYLHTNLEELPKGLTTLNNLKRLAVKGKKMRLADNIGDLQNLTQLNLDVVQLALLPKSIAKLSKLSYISFVLEQQSINEHIEMLLTVPNLEALTLYQNAEGNFPTALFKLKNLKKLHLRSSDLELVVPDEFGKLANLEELHIRGYLISAYPKSLATLSKLQRLNISHYSTQDKSVQPDFIEHLSALEQLDLYGFNNLVLFEDWSKLQKMTDIDIAYCGLSHLPESIYRLAKLKNLSLYFNKIAKLSDNLGNLGALELLDVSQNQLQMLPKSVGNLSNLRTLNIRSNKDFIGFPQEFWNCRRLQKIDAYSTSLGSISPNIVALSSLKVLNLSLCPQLELPQSLCELQQLEYLNITVSMFEQKTPIDFTCLKNLSVFFTPQQMTDKEIEAFAKKMPNCIINPTGGYGTWGSEWDR